MDSLARTLLVNKKAKHDYHLLEQYEAGLMLEGSEIKSIINKDFSIKESFIRIINSEAFIFNLNIKKLANVDTFAHFEENRTIKLLLHKKEIKKLQKEIEIKGNTIVPIKVHVNERGLVKVDISLAKGKKNYDKRNSLKEKDSKRNLEIQTKANY